MKESGARVMETENTTRVCLSLCEPRAAALCDSMRRADPRADLLELRLDGFAAPDERQEIDNLCRCFDRLDSTVDEKLLARPLIFTLRPREQGGSSHLAQKERLELILRCVRAASAARVRCGSSFVKDFIDLELDAAEACARREAMTGETVCDWTQTICSFHDFNGVPENLEGILRRMKNTPARILKIAVAVQESVDGLMVFQLLRRNADEAVEQANSNERRELIALAMNDAGKWTRVLGVARGSFLTYAATGEMHTTAPGQTTVAELHDLYRIKRIDARTVVTGIIGAPVAHSLSPQMHNEAFAVRKLNYVYLPFQVADLSQFIKRFAARRTREIDFNLRGLSVTAPHKTRIIPYLDRVSQRAREIGAVNTITIEDGELCGDNTDAAGFLVPLCEKMSIERASVAVRGAGGAARAAVWSLRRAGARVTVFARRLEKAKALADEFGADAALLTADARFGKFDVIVNTTPLGTIGELINEAPARRAQLSGARLAYDLVYNPCETLFLREAAAAGVETLGGLQMLVEQAARQFEMWTNESAPRVEMLAAARAALGESEKAHNAEGE